MVEKSMVPEKKTLKQKWDGLSNGQKVAVKIGVGAVVIAAIGGIVYLATKDKRSLNKTIDNMEGKYKLAVMIEDPTGEKFMIKAYTATEFGSNIAAEFCEDATKLMVSVLGEPTENTVELEGEMTLMTF